MKKIIKECRKHVECDTARISVTGGKMFFIIGNIKNTKDENFIIVDENNNRKDFDYIQETVIASGYTKEELIDSVKEYKRLSTLTLEEYLKEM